MQIPGENNPQEQIQIPLENQQKNLPIDNSSTRFGFAQQPPLTNQEMKNAKLYQNVPNPFSANTEISFEIPENSISARLLIHDMQGGEIKAYTITGKGAGNIIIKGSELSAGMYMYTLLVNNVIVDTKKMILTK